jgi:hypothetical protein
MPRVEGGNPAVRHVISELVKRGIFVKPKRDIELWQRRLARRIGEWGQRGLAPRLVGTKRPNHATVEHYARLAIIMERFQDFTLAALLLAHDGYSVSDAALSTALLSLVDDDDGIDRYIDPDNPTNVEWDETESYAQDIIERRLSKDLLGQIFQHSEDSKELESLIVSAIYAAKGGEFFAASSLIQPLEKMIGVNNIKHDSHRDDPSKMPVEIVRLLHLNPSEPDLKGYIEATPWSRIVADMRQAFKWVVMTHVINHARCKLPGKRYIQPKCLRTAFQQALIVAFNTASVDQLASKLADTEVLDKEVIEEMRRLDSQVRREIGL